jgi:hypothetical protein
MKRLLENILSHGREAFHTLLEALREIFDESAYSRFLQRTGEASSHESYAAFRREFEQAKVRRPKCC